MRRIAFALLYAFLTATAHAQPWPTQPIKIVVGFPPGGMADVLPRKMQDALAAALRQPVIVENKPGGAGSIAHRWVARCSRRARCRRTSWPGCNEGSSTS